MYSYFFISQIFQNEAARKEVTEGNNIKSQGQFLHVFFPLVFIRIKEDILLDIRSFKALLRFSREDYVNRIKYVL